MVGFYLPGQLKPLSPGNLMSINTRSTAVEESLLSASSPFAAAIISIEGNSDNKYL